MKRCIVLVSDQNYSDHAKYLFASLKLKGNWHDEFCLIGNSLNPITIKEFEDRGIKVLNVNQNNPYYAKYFLFDKFFKQWDRVCYFDVDFIIQGDVNGIFESNTALLCCDDDGNPLSCYFSDTKELFKGYDMNSPSFNSSCMIYDTNLIGDDTVKDIMNLSDMYESVNIHNGNGTDQSIFNLYFYNQWVNIKHVSYIFKQSKKEGVVAIHTCGWNAPWKYKNRVMVVNNKSGNDVFISEMNLKLPASDPNKEYNLDYEISLRYKHLLYPVKIIEPSYYTEMLNAFNLQNF